MSMAHCMSENRCAAFPALLWHCAVAVLTVAWCGIALCGEIHDAAKSGDLNKVKALLEANPTLISSKDENGWTPLHFAAANGRKYIVQFLLEKKSDIHARNNNGETPLDLAAFHKDVAAILQDNGGAARKTTSHDPTIFKAASDGDMAAVAALVKDDPDEVSCKDDDECTALDWASKMGHADIVTFLLGHKADIEARNNQNMTPLMGAAYHNHADVVALLLSKGAEVNATASDDPEKDSTHGHHALDLAASAGYKDVVKILLDNKADVNAQMTNGWTALHYAVIEGWGGTEDDYKKVVELLLAHGAEINQKDNGGATPLYYAAENGKVVMVELLWANGADVNAKDKHGKTPLHVATDIGIKGTEVVNFLTKHGGTY